jgi:hypothetical protein
MARTGDIDTTEAKIIRFIERMDLVRENPQYPGSENWNYSEDSAVRYIEAALNYKNAHVSWFYEFKIEDSTETLISSNSAGFFNIVSIREAYDDIVASIGNQYEAIVAEHKALLYIDVVNLGINNNNLQIKSLMFYGKGQQTLPDGEWYIEGNNGMLSPTLYNMQNAMIKIVQQTGISVLGGANQRVDVYYTDLEKDSKVIPIEPYSGFYYSPNFLPGYWLYAEKAYYQTPSPHYLFAQSLNSNQISFYASNLETLGNIRANKKSKADFDWKVYLSYGVIIHTDPLIRWMNADIYLGVEHSRVNIPVSNIQ